MTKQTSQFGQSALNDRIVNTVSAIFNTITRCMTERSK